MDISALVASHPDTASVNPVQFIDDLLHEKYLFVVDVRHNPALVRDAAFYRRGVAQIETVYCQLKAHSECDACTDHVSYAQRGLLDDAMALAAVLFFGLHATQPG